MEYYLFKAIAHNHRAKPIPRHKRQISISALIPHQPLATSLLQVGIENTRDAPDLAAIPVQDGREVLLWVVEDEPSSLAKVRALAGGLEMQPGLREELFGRRGVLEGGGGVVGGEEIFNYGAGFPQLDVGVWVFDGGNSAVGIDGFEGLCMGDLVRAMLCFNVLGRED